MSINFTYMGTKRRIADHVAEVIDVAPPGPLLDIFAGMSAVGTAIIPDRNVWCNDVQHFAHYVATAYFASATKAKFTPEEREHFYCLFIRQRNKLLNDHIGTLELEDAAIASGSATQLRQFCADLVEVSTNTYATTRLSRRDSSDYLRYSLFSTAFAGGFIGLRQAIDIDSIKFAIDQSYTNGVIDAECERWMQIALCQALAKASSSTGHFAQYLTPKEKNLTRFIVYRRRDIWLTWERAVLSMQPLGSASWRAGNRTFRNEAVELLDTLRDDNNLPAVVYADPPYTSDHYSRYYHLWETLLLYDFPEISSKGQYRSDRFYSPFSIKTRVESAFEELIKSASELGSYFVLSYPEVGLLDNSTIRIVDLLKSRFKHVEIAREIGHEHSTLGASKGSSASSVTEKIYLAHN